MHFKLQAGRLYCKLRLMRGEADQFCSLLIYAYAAHSGGLCGQAGTSLTCLKIAWLGLTKADNQICWDREGSTHHGRRHNQHSMKCELRQQSPCVLRDLNNKSLQHGQGLVSAKASNKETKSTRVVLYTSGPSGPAAQTCFVLL